MLTFEQFLSEAPRIRIIPVRLRRDASGKIVIQRRVKKSNVKGFTLRNGKMVRISPITRMHMRQGQRRAKIKRRAKARMIARKRSMTMKRRHSMGL